MSFLAKRGIGSQVMYPLEVPYQPAYRHLGYRGGDFPVADAHVKEILRPGDGCAGTRLGYEHTWRREKMKVLGIMGSSRRDGNTNDLLDMALRGAAEAGADVEKIVLLDYNIHHIYNIFDQTRRGGRRRPPSRRARSRSSARFAAR